MLIRDWQICRSGQPVHFAREPVDVLLGFGVVGWEQTPGFFGEALLAGGEVVGQARQSSFVVYSYERGSTEATARYFPREALAGGESVDQAQQSNLSNLWVRVEWSLSYPHRLWFTVMRFEGSSRLRVLRKAFVRFRQVVS
eukprot:jgi/Botrbrau1/21115/Bobra.0061s0010.1